MAVKIQNFAGQESMTRIQFPKLWEYRPNQRKELSHWSKYELPSLQLIGTLDTDHWTKLKRKHKQFSKSLNNLKEHPSSPNALPMPSSGLHRYYYDQSQRRDTRAQKSMTMYYMPEGHGEGARVNKSVPKRASIYNQHAKEGFKFWLDRDPMLNKISFCSKYTFGSKHTVHGLGNAPRN